MSRRAVGAAMLTILAVSSVYIGAQSRDAGAGLTALADAERQFARAARDKGWRAAFLEYFADDAIAFAPSVMPAKPRLRLRPVRPFSEEELTWEPRTGDIAASGELGWLTGPSTFIDHTAAKQPPGYGNYLSIWKKQRDGRWRVFIDIGTQAPSPVPFAPGFVRMPMPSRFAATRPVEDARLSLLQRDNDLNASLDGEAAARVYPRFVAPGARLHRNGSDTLPAVGADAIAAWFAAHPAKTPAITAAAESSGAGDLGYTYGAYTASGQNAPGAYVRIWARTVEGVWLLQVDATVPSRS